jgi:hypothetical protein
MKLYKTKVSFDPKHTFLNYQNKNKGNIDFERLRNEFYFHPSYYSVFQNKKVMTTKLLNELCGNSNYSHKMKKIFDMYPNVYFQEHGIHTLHVRNQHAETNYDFVINLDVDDDDNDDHDNDDHNNYIYNYYDNTNIWRLFLWITIGFVCMG